MPPRPPGEPQGQQDNRLVLQSISRRLQILVRRWSRLAPEMSGYRSKEEASGGRKKGDIRQIFDIRVFDCQRDAPVLKEIELIY